MYCIFRIPILEMLIKYIANFKKDISVKLCCLACIFVYTVFVIPKGFYLHLQPE
jgi:hypothetical protein